MSSPTSISIIGRATKTNKTAEKVSHPLDPTATIVASGTVYAARYLRSFTILNIYKKIKFYYILQEAIFAKTQTMAIEYVYNTRFVLKNEKSITSWINDVIVSEKHVLGDLIFAFFSDEDLRQINIKHLKQDYYTDVISFDASESGRVSGNIAVSIDRVKENAKTYDSSFDNELYRVMVHGVLHCDGYNDNTKEEKERIRKAENLKLKMFHVEQ